MPVDFEALCVNIDRIVSFEMRMQGASRGVIEKFYNAERQRQGGKPLTYLAARGLIERVKPGDTVLVLTGAGKYPQMPHGETDGPPGAAAVARGVAQALGAKVMVLSEPENLPPVEGAMRGIGFNILPWEDAQGLSWGGTPAPFPNKGDDGIAFSRQLVEKLKPAAVISVEKQGPNKVGVIHSATGTAYSNAFLARAHVLVETAREAGAFTIGIGDNGNEIGFGNIVDVVRKVKEWGDVCQCPCKGGIATVTGADVLIPAGTSNWGGYGLEAALCAMVERPDLMHDAETEARMLELCFQKGAADATQGMMAPSVDGTPVRISVYIADILHTLIHHAFKTRKRSW